jgi:hypothetical protein
MQRRAVMAFPDDRGEPLCRLVLGRVAPHGLIPADAPPPTAAWLLCNPSRASHLVDDPTAGRIMHYSNRAHCPRSLVGNVWAWRSPYPADLWEALENGSYTPAMHRANLDALAMIGGQADIHVAAFGAADRRHSRFVSEALDAFTLGGRFPLLALGTTDDDMPLHPLARGKHAVRNDATLRPWARGCLMMLARETSTI